MKGKRERDFGEEPRRVLPGFVVRFAVEIVEFRRRGVADKGNEGGVGVSVAEYCEW
jgi:hypothetical protein